jgi:hypothetical protein
MITTLGALVLLLLPVPSPREFRCPIDYLDMQALHALAIAGNARDLDSAFKSVIRPDGVTRLIYASRRASLTPGPESDALLVAAIPHSKLDFDLLYTLTYPDMGIEPMLGDIASGFWLDQVLDAVVRQKRGAEDLLMLTYIGRNNMDLGEMWPGFVATLKQRSPALFREALRRLPTAVQAEVKMALESEAR